MHAMILAAGRGERLRPLTDSTPKAMLVVGGKPLIEYHLERLALAGFQEVVINVAHLGEQIRTALGDGSKWGLHIQYSQEPAAALETGGGIQQALPLLGRAPFAVLNADIYSDYPLARLRALKCDQAHLILVPNPQHNPAGDFSLQGGRIGDNGEPHFSFSGISIYHPRFFEDAGEGCYSIVPMLRKAARARLLTGELYRGDWQDIGTHQRLGNLRQNLAAM